MASVHASPICHEHVDHELQVRDLVILPAGNRVVQDVEPLPVAGNEAEAR
jgi:hypothetical protein